MTDTWIIAVATVAGPLSAVVLTLFIQARFNASQSKFQQTLMVKLEEDRRNWEMKRENSKGAYDEAWDVANRDRFNRLIQAIESLAKHTKEDG